MKHHAPRCGTCKQAMRAAFPSACAAVSHDAERGTTTEVESSVWECAECGRKAAQPERWLVRDDEAPRAEG